MRFYLLLSTCIAGLIVLPSCSPNGGVINKSTGLDASIVLNENDHGNDKVENGTAYDRSAVDLGKARKIILPHDAVVRRAGETAKFELFMAKTLAFFGHPPEPMSIRNA